MERSGPDPRDAIVYDADCGFCRWSLGLLLRWDHHRRLRPVALQDSEAAQLLPGMSQTERMRSLHLVERGGRVHSGGAALAPLARRLPAGAPLARLAAALPALSERGYRLVADHRSWLGRVLSQRAKARARELIDERSAPAGAKDGGPGRRAPAPGQRA